MFQKTFLDDVSKTSSGEAAPKRKLPELKLAPNSLNVLKKRYLKKISDTESEQPEEMF